MNLKGKKETLIGVGMILFGVFYILSTLTIKKVANVTVGAEFIPRIYAYVIIILGLIQVAISYPKEKGKTPETNKAKEETDGKNVLLAFLAILIYVVIMKPIGYIISSILFLFTMCIIITPVYKKKNYIGYLIFAVALSVITFYIFKKLMFLALPMGILGF
ncbi:tripartite tricarboxylate transporter TctB family protein [Tissierella sp. Yu-01]|uniref:tripartite tricarboxylate transporter TctB family protein n=1 Tax=Tissierella sp. Yu-01 TaxID=3035694 RepID=UPI00240E6E4E|nr:tripartite tricarboxylate transporter TctB family protein [Tissierella sp. Yu-01]WFA08536.1 tripartite tricarboxylate transporter TctB family protein [Tissierella sp. Yu-01]